MGAQAQTQETALVLPSQDQVQVLIQEENRDELNRLSGLIVRQGEPFVDVQMLRAAEVILRATCNYLAPLNIVPRIPEHFGVQIVVARIDVRDVEKGGDIFCVSKEWKKNDGTKVPAKYDINARGLLKISNALGIGWLGSTRHDDGSDPFYADLEAHGSVRNFTTGEMLPISGRGDVDLREGSADAKRMSDRNLAEARRFPVRTAETRAQKRAIKKHVALVGSMTKDVFERPFAAPVLVFDSRNVHSQEAAMVHHQVVMQAASRASSMLFGGQSRAVPAMPAFTGQPQTPPKSPPPPLPGQDAGAEYVDHETGEVSGEPDGFAMPFGEPF